MKYKRFLVGAGAFLLTTGALLFIGHRFSIGWLMFHYEYENDDNGFYFSASSFMPLVIGLVMSFIAEKMYVRRATYKKRSEF